VSRPALGPAQPPIQWVPGALYLGGKAAGAWSWPLTPVYCGGEECVALYRHSPSTTSWRGAQEHRENFTFTFVFKNGTLH